MAAESKNKKATLAPLTSENVTVIATDKKSFLKKGKDYNVSGILANTLISKGFATLKNEK